MSRGWERDDDRPPASDADRPAGFGADAHGRQTHHAWDGKTERRRENGLDRESLTPLPTGTRREVVHHVGQAYRLRGSESRLLHTLGTFRLALERDVAMGVYRGDASAMAADIRSLVRQRLVLRQGLAANRSGGVQYVVTLSPTGRDLVSRHPRTLESSTEPRSPVHAGWGKRSELVHDASLYRMYLVEADRIVRQGGVVRHVRLDEELKARLYAHANAEPGLSADARQARLLDAAHREDVAVIEGHLRLPDLRLEYDTAAGERTKVDLELTTIHYHAGSLAAKQQAGFTLYSAAGNGSRGVRSLGGVRSSGFDPRFLSGLLSL